MSSKLSLTVLTALALAVAAGRVAHAAPMTTTDFASAEAGNPESIDYANRMAPSHPVTNDEINAAERGNPESTDYANRPPLMLDGNARAEWQAAESGNPHSI